MASAIEQDRGSRYRDCKEYGKAMGTAVAEDLLDENGEPITVVLILADVTEKPFEGTDDDGKPKVEVKQILWWEAKPGKRQFRPIVCGKEVWQTVKALLAKYRGSRIDDWIGFRIAWTAEITKRFKKTDEVQWGLRPVGSPDITEDFVAVCKLGKKGGGKTTKRRTIRAMTNGSGPTTSRAPGPGGAS